MSERRVEQWARCEPCGQCWHLFSLPMAAERAALLVLRATCPKCGAAAPQLQLMARRPIEVTLTVDAKPFATAFKSVVDAFEIRLEGRALADVLAKHLSRDVVGGKGGSES